MRRIPAAVLAAVFACAAPAQEAPPPAASPADEFWAGVKRIITTHLGRPYVWGACGRKSFDCSGFLWRVMTENGVAIKRTTARKYYVALFPAAQDEGYRAGNVVFFDDLKHVGIVADRSTFYHSAVTKGTHLASFNPYWRPKIVGFRLMPRKKPGP